MTGVRPTRVKQARDLLDDIELAGYGNLPVVTGFSHRASAKGTRKTGTT